MMSPHQPSDAFSLLDQNSTLFARFRIIDNVATITRLVESIFGAMRTRPLLVVSCAGDTREPRVDVDALLDVVGQSADVAVLATVSAAWRLSERLPENMSAYGGAVRLFWPDAQPSDSPRHHPLYTTASPLDGAKTITRVARDLTSAGFTVASDVSGVGRASTPAAPAAPRVRGLRAVGDDTAALGLPGGPAPAAPAGGRAATTDLSGPRFHLTSLRPAPSGRAPASAPQGQDAAEGDVPSAPQPPATRESAHPCVHEAMLAAQAKVAAEQEDVITRLRTERDEAERKARSASEEVTGLRRQVRSMTDRIGLLEQRLHGSGAFSDPARQFEHETFLAWLNGVEEADRHQYRLRSYRIGPDFLASLDAQDSLDRSRVVAACMDVICQRVWAMNSRGAHQHQVGPRNAPHVVREDGAAAWRCAIQQQTPSARRLLWWELPDGSVELAKVAVAEDYTIR